jgi:putative ABC transport system permease protein
MEARVKQDLKFALRLLSRSPVWTSVAVLSLALGIGANTLAFSLVDGVLLEPFPYRDPGRLVLLWASKSEGTTRGIAGPDLQDWRDQNHTFEDIDAFLGNMKFSLGSDPSDTVPGACIGARVLPLLGRQPALGRNFVAADEAAGATPVVILSDGLWRTRFGSDPMVVGRTIRLEGKPHEVVGVTPSGFFFPDTDARLWIPLPCGFAGFESRGTPLLHAVGRLKLDVVLQRAQADLDAVNRRLAQTYPATNRDKTVGIFPLRHILIGKFDRALWMLQGGVALVLLIACGNVTHLQLARGVERETELAVRVASGASRWRLVRQLLTESLALAVPAGALGVLLAWLGTQAIHAFSLTDIPRIETVRLDGLALAFTVTISLLAGIMSGVWPARRASGVHVGETLKSGGQTSPHANRTQLRDLLAITEIAAAITLLVVAGLVLRSFVYLSHAEWGFNPDRLLLIDAKVPPELKNQRDPAERWAESVVERLRTIDGVEHASRSDGVPIRWASWKPTALAVDGTIVTTGWTAGTWVAGPDYFATAGIRILEGREFTSDDTATSPNRVVISQALARKLWPDRHAVGKRLQVLVLKTVNGKPLPEVIERIKRRDRTVETDPSALEPVDGKTWEVIGVADDVRMFSLDVTPNPSLYMNYQQNPRSSMWGMDMSGFAVKFLLRTTGRPAEIADRAKAAILSVNSGATLTEVASMQDLVSAKVGGRGTNKLMLVVSALFGSLALMFAVIGIYGVVSHTISQRGRELGIRVALGADRSDVIRMVMGYALRLLLLGLGLGLAMAWAATRGLQAQLWGVTATDSVTYVGALILLSGAALAACILPLRRALRFDPLVLFKA